MMGNNLMISGLVPYATRIITKSVYILSQFRVLPLARIPLICLNCNLWPLYPRRVPVFTEPPQGFVHLRMRWTCRANPVSLQHCTEVNIFSERVGGRVFIPEIFCPFPPEKPAVADQIDKFKVFIHSFPAHSRVFCL